MSRQKKNSLWGFGETSLDEELVEAVSQNDLKAIRSLMVEGADIRYKDPKSGFSVLHVAAERGAALEIVQYLVNMQGALAGDDGMPLQDKKGQTALHRACARGHAPLTALLLSNGANPHTTDRQRQTPLHLAAKAGHLDCVRRLLSAGASPNVSDKNGNYPLHLAMEQGLSVDMVRELATSTPEEHMDHRGEYERSPLWLACFYGRVGALECLLEYGADPKLKGRGAGFAGGAGDFEKPGQSFHWMVRAQDKKRVKDLLAKGVAKQKAPLNAKPLSSSRSRMSSSASIGSSTSARRSISRQQSSRQRRSSVRSTGSRGYNQTPQRRFSSTSQQKRDNERAKITQGRDNWEVDSVGSYDSDMTFGSRVSYRSDASHREGFGYVPKEERERRRSISHEPTPTNARRHYEDGKNLFRANSMSEKKTRHKVVTSPRRAISAHPRGAQQKSSPMQMELNEAALAEHNLRQGGGQGAGSGKVKLTTRRYAAPSSNADDRSPLHGKVTSHVDRRAESRSRRRNRQSSSVASSREGSVDSRSSVGTVQSYVSYRSAASVLSTDSTWRERKAYLSSQRQQKYEKSQRHLQALRDECASERSYSDASAFMEEPEEPNQDLEEGRKRVGRGRRNFSSSDSQASKSFSALYDQKQKSNRNQLSRNTIQSAVSLDSANLKPKHRKDLSLIPEDFGSGEKGYYGDERTTNSAKVDNALRPHKVLDRSVSAPKPSSHHAPLTRSSSDGFSNPLYDWLKEGLYGKQNQQTPEVTTIKFLPGGEIGKMDADWLNQETDPDDISITEKTKASASKLFLNVMGVEPKKEADAGLSPERTTARKTSPALEVRKAADAHDHDAAVAALTKSERTESCKQLPSGGELAETNQRLLTASEEGDLETVKAVLKERKDGKDMLREVVDRLGHSALHLAARAGHLEVVQFLTETGGMALLTGLMEAFHNRYTPLHLGAIHGHAEVVKYLEGQGWNVNQTSRNQTMTPLHLAAMKGQLQCVHALISLGADPATTNLCLRTPLHEVCRRAIDNAQTAEAIVNTLLEAHPNHLHFQDKDGMTALHSAAMTGQEVLVRTLLRQGAQVNSRTGQARTPLWLAAFYGRTGCMRELLVNGADVLLAGVDDSKGNNNGSLVLPGDTFHPSVDENVKRDVASLLQQESPPEDTIRVPLTEANQGKSPSAVRFLASFEIGGKPQEDEIPTTPSAKEQKLIAWLEEVGCPELAKSFIDEGYDLEFISEHGLGEDDLDSIGVTKLGLRKKLLTSFKLEAALGKDLHQVDETPEYDRESDSSCM